MTITQANNNITILTDDGDTYTGTVDGAIYTFSGDLGQIQEPGGQWGTATIKGTFELISETSMSGDYTFEWTDGSYIHTEEWEFTGIRVDIVGVKFQYNYLQYRSSNTFNGNRGYVELTKDGIPVAQSDIMKIELKDSSGALVNLGPVNFNPTTYYYGMWNSGTASVDFSGPESYTGFWWGFPAGFDLPSGDYTFEVTTSDNSIVSKTINYPGKKILPIVNSATMTSQWLVDGSLKLSWTNPPGDYDQLRLVISDLTAGEMLYARLPVNVSEMTIPSDWVKIIWDFYSLTTVRWQVQTRSHTAEDMNYARGISDWVIIPGKTEACGEGLPLTIGNLSFPGTVTKGTFYNGSVTYQGAFEDIANPIMFSRIPYTGGVTTFVPAAAPIVSNCSMDFSSRIPDNLTGTGTIYFKLIDYDDSVDTSLNWDNNAVSNEISKTITIQ